MNTRDKEILKNAKEEAKKTRVRVALLNLLDESQTKFENMYFGGFSLTFPSRKTIIERFFKW